MTLYLDRLMGAAKRAVEAGAVPFTYRDGTQHSRHWEWDAAGSCERPVFRELFARPDRTKFRHLDVDPKSRDVPFRLDVWARCRKCRHCLFVKQRLWETRAMAELRAAVRTWFVTLTIDPAHMYMAEARAIREFDQRGKDPRWSSFEALPYDQRFRAVHGVLSKEVTNWIKRLRNTGAAIRYLLVTEVGEKRGRVHFHLLVHEVDPERPITSRQLDGKWTYGFVKAKLASDDGAARYLCKYLVKSALARVRASQDYGHPEATPEVFARVPLNVLRHRWPKDKGHRDPAPAPPGRGDIPASGGLNDEVSRSRVSREVSNVLRAQSGFSGLSNEQPADFNTSSSPNTC